MILSDQDIIEAIRTQDILIGPFNRENLQPASYDVQLGRRLKMPTYSPTAENPERVLYREVDLGSMDNKPFYLHRHEFVLAEVAEHLELSNCIGAQVVGRSTIGRMGLAIHITAGWVDPGWRGRLTLELHNCGPAPILLRAGMPIGQLVFMALLTTAQRTYSGRYLGAEGVEEPKVAAQ